MIAAALRRSLLAAMRGAMTRKGGCGGLLRPDWSALLERRGCREGETMQDKQTSDDARDQSASWKEAPCPESTHNEFVVFL
jgi:hypothetical protein